MSKKVIAVMFSGGVDSTYAAWSQIPNFEEIRLITFVRTGLRNPQNTQKAVDRLCKAFPDKQITHQLIDYEDLYHRVSPDEEKKQVQNEVLSQEIGPLWDDPDGMHRGQKKYDIRVQKFFTANECLQCKIAMHLAAIRFCRDNDIDMLCDGSNTEQPDDGSQLEDVKNIARDLFSRYGINYFSPVFHVTEEERSKSLFAAGVTDYENHKALEKSFQIPTRQIQCTVPSSVLWTVCIFPWLAYDETSFNDYIQMSCSYYKDEMEKGLKTILGYND